MFRRRAADRPRVVGGTCMAILEVRNLVKYYRKPGTLIFGPWRKVVDGVSFEVNLGEVVGLLGPNGAGKTTSFRMATGQVTPNEGRVLFDGKDVTNLQQFRRARLGLGYLDQKDSVFRKLTVEGNILAILEMLPKHRTLGRRLTRSERYDITDQKLAQFGLTHLRKNGAARLSGGERRRLEIARCLACDPLLILLDEPFTGIDPPTIADIKNIIRSLRDQGIGILITDHQVREILSVTDRSYLIASGKVFAHGSPAELVRNQDAIRTYIGHTADGLVFSDGTSTGTPSAAGGGPPKPAFKDLVEQDRVQTLLDRLRSQDSDTYQNAARALIQHGPAAIPAVVEALAWRDMELRRRASEVLQKMWPGVPFDPFAPEAERQRQLAAVRAALERKSA
jgi:lipopolysaccharide export system ATP-binding protein